MVKGFSFGIRFDMVYTDSSDDAARFIFEEIFSVLTTSDLRGIEIYGGMANESDPAENGIYTVFMSGGSLKEMRRIFKKLKSDEGIKMYLASSSPFIEKNNMNNLSELDFFGEVKWDGTLKGGNKEIFGLMVPKKHGKRRPVGKNIKMVLAPDSFKGSIGSSEAIKRLTLAARRHFPGVRIVPVPIADGGEGTVEALVTAASGSYRFCEATSPMGRRIKARYGVLYGKTAIIEMAAASGMNIDPTDGFDLTRASSFGTGELIRRALDEGIRDIIIGIGGSATNDCGIGCARALGFKLYDKDDNELTGTGSDMINVRRIDSEFMHPRIKDTRFTVMCDVTNPLLGESGATMTYGPQKGGTPEQLNELELGMQNMCNILSDYASADVNGQRGAGAAGGMGAMLFSLLGAELKPGIDALLQAVDFHKLLKGAALVVTGEGRLDSQTTRNGKAVAGILKACCGKGIPVAIITGSLGENAEEIYDIGNAGIMTLINAPMTGDEAIQDAVRLFDDAADRMFRLIRMGRDVEKIGAPKLPGQRWR